MAVNFQSETEVKEYLETIGIEYRFGCYSEKKPDVCHLLGDYLESVKQDFDKAAKVYRSTCDDYGYAKSCLKYGHYSFLGKGMNGGKASPSLGFQYYEKGCNLKCSESCLHGGLIMISKSMDKKAVERDFPKGIELLTKSCEMDNGGACFHLSSLHLSGVQRSEVGAVNKSTQKGTDPKLSTVLRHDGEFVVAKDMEKAFNFAYKACELKNMYACANLSMMYAKGEGTKQSDEKAEKFKKIVLDMQAQYQPQKTLQFQQ